ncbi:PH domain-containing protein [Gelidibacter sp.]|uniref:PH domain-containing protein n=1 Tax=Gelidibacter sp. TaxID=2018083 RepID=UPI002D13BF60|nr:PH domain-containing protein [Gelidibacter sp.]HUH27353.1 PH domain-containing protein [Gelidibacter sp.]
MFTNQQINLDTLPSIDDVKLKPISKQYLKIIVINRVFFYGLLIAALFLAKSIVVHVNFQSVFWYLLSVGVFLCVVNFVSAILAFKKRKYAIREQDVIYSKGLLVNSISAVPISRIQHLEISRSWLARRFDLATLKIFTAGESGIDLRIDGLNFGEAKQINDFLSKRVNGTD